MQRPCPSAVCLVLALCSWAAATDAYSVHVVTFNVKENKGMPKGALKADTAEQLLQLDSSNPMRDIYVVALQENCFKCNSGSLKDLAAVFLEQLNKRSKNEYTYVALADTRSSPYCELTACGPVASQHGTSVTMVFSRRDLVTAFDGRRRHNCMTPWWFYRNAEKGLVGLKLNMTNGNQLCFVSGHLDSISKAGRHNCIASFFGSGKDDYEDASEADLREKRDSLWHEGCDSIFLAGDFNTRTAEKKAGSSSKDPIIGTTKVFNKVLPMDELSGSTPYTGQSLLQFIRDTTKRPFVEPLRPIVDVPDFVATYSLLHKNKCGQQTPCYNPKRPISWTDRIVCYNCGRVLSYKPLNTMYGLSDHLPVVGIFQDV